MALASWPSDLPSMPLHASQGIAKPYPDAVVGEAEDGPDIMRVWSRTAIRRLPYSLPFKTGAEFSAFDSFVVEDLDQGTAHFTMPVFMPGEGCVTRRVYIENGQWSSRQFGASGQLVTFTLCVFPG